MDTQGERVRTRTNELFSVCVGLRCPITSGATAARTTSAWVELLSPPPRPHYPAPMASEPPKLLSAVRDHLADAQSRVEKKIDSPLPYPQ